MYSMQFGRYPLHYAYALPEVVSNAIVRLLLENNEPKMEILRDKVSVMSTSQ